MKSVQANKRAESATVRYVQAQSVRDAAVRAKRDAEVEFLLVDAALQRNKAILARIAEDHKFAQSRFSAATRAVVAAENAMQQAFAAIPRKATNQKVA